MTAEAAVALVPANGAAQDKRELAVLKAVGLERAAPEQRELALAIAKQYDLDLMLRHLILVEGRPYITRDGLLHVAHRSGQLDGMETTEPAIVEGFWRSTCSVYRKDMGHPFTYTGRYPTSGGNAKFAPEMAVKVAEVMALRRAFDVAAPAADERWDVDVPTEPAPPIPSLAERAAAKAAAITPDEAGSPAAAGVSSPERTAETPAPTTEPVAGGGTGQAPEAQAAAGGLVSGPPAALSKQAFVDRIDAAGIDQQHATTVRLVMFPNVAEALDDAQRGQLWQALEAEATSAR